MDEKDILEDDQEHKINANYLEKNDEGKGFYSEDILNYF